MKSSLLSIITLIVSSFSIWAQWDQASRDRINRLNRDDHQLMMEQLKIESLRPGPSGNPDDPNAANADESKAKTYESLPDPLIFNNGEKVKIPKDWEKRKVEIFEDFDREIYGRMPPDTPKVTWEVESEQDTTRGEFPITVRELIGRVDNATYPELEVKIEMKLVLPANAKEAVPVIIHFRYILPPHWKLPPEPEPTWRQQILAKGWGYAELIPTSYQADNGAGLRSGIIGLVNKGKPRKPDDWGSLRAWAWGSAAWSIILKPIIWSTKTDWESKVCRGMEKQL